MPERNHEVVIDGYVFPDTVTVTLANDEYDEYVNSRDYVSKELYESVCGANDAWQSDNARLRELVRGLHMAYVGAINKCESLDESLIWEYSGNIEDDVAKSKAEYESDRHRFDVAMRELRVEVTAR